MARARRASAAVAGSAALNERASARVKSNALVRSPHTARRHGEMFGSSTPKRCSMKRITEVWSNTCELTQPPVLQGEITNIGTRGQSP